MRESAPVPKSLRLWLTGAILAVGIAFIFVLFQGARGAELGDTRAMDQAQVARNLARGAGYTTRVIRPLSLAKVPQVENHPEFANAPLHPFCMSIMFRLFGANARSVSWTSGLAFLFTIPLVLWLAWHLFSRKIAMLSIFVVATNIGLLMTAVSGTEGALLAFLFTALALVLVYHAERASRRLVLTVAAGLLVGLIYLTSYYWGIVIIPVLAVLLLNAGPKQRILHIILFFAAVAILLGPWTYRTWRLTGDPFFNLCSFETMVETCSHPGNTVYRTYATTPPGVLSFVFNSPREVYQKARDAAVNLYPLIFALAGAAVMPFFVVAMLIPMGVIGADRLRIALYGTIILVLVVLCLTVPDARLMLAVAPAATVIAVAFFYQLLDLRTRTLSERQRHRWTNTAVTLLLLAHAVPLLMQLAPGRPFNAQAPAATKRAGEELRSVVRGAGGGAATATAPVYTDVPWAVAWYADRTAIWLPTADMDVRRLEQDVGQIRWLVLTPQINDVWRAELARKYADLWVQGWAQNLTTGAWRVRQRFANGRWILFERVPDMASVGSL